MTNIRPFKGISPTLGEQVYIDEFSCVIGRVTIGNHSSIWPGVVVRGDVNTIEIGSCTNIQDGSILHVSRPSSKSENGSPLVIGNQVTVGHQVMLHGCTIQDRVLIGMSSVVLDNVLIEENILLGAGSLVPPGKVLKSGFLYLGSPVKQIRELTTEEVAEIKYLAQHYVDLKNTYFLE